MVTHIHIVFTKKKTGNLITLFKRDNIFIFIIFFFINAINEFHTYLIHCNIKVTWNEVKNMTLKQP